MSNWGDYQSLIQISIALNAAYFSLSQFLNPDAANQKSLISTAIGVAENDASGQNFSERLQRVLQDVNGQKEKDKNFFRLFRVASAVLFLLGIILLFIGSYKSTDTVGDWIILVCALLNAPFVIGLCYMFLVSSPQYDEFSKERQKIQDELGTFLSTPKKTPKQAPKNQGARKPRGQKSATAKKPVAEKSPDKKKT